MWDYLKPILVVIIVFGLAIFLTHSCIEQTGGAYYSHNYPGGVYIGGVYHVPRGVMIRGGK